MGQPHQPHTYIYGLVSDVDNCVAVHTIPHIYVIRHRIHLSRIYTGETVAHTIVAFTYQNVYIRDVTLHVYIRKTILVRHPRNSKNRFGAARSKRQKR